VGEDITMPEHKGIFIVLEGADGSGKGTQFKLLAERLKAVGYDIEVFDFPRYDEPSSHFVRKYLNGEYGSAADISPYTASLFFALDRYEASPAIKKALNEGKIVLSNRFVGSNMAHQGGKFTSSGEQRGFFIWEDGLEYQLLGIPRPNVNIFLRVPAEVSYELIAQKTKRSYTDESHDQHEGDIEHLKNSVATYDTLCKLFPKDFKAIECAPGGKLMSIAEINDKIWNEIKPILPEKPPHKAKDVVVQLNEPEENETKPVNTAVSEVPEPQVITPDNENSGELNITIKKVSLLAASRVQAVPGIKCEVIATQWPVDGTYNFYTPANVPKNLSETYKTSLNKLAALHKKIHEELKKNSKKEDLESLLGSMAPLAALSSLKIVGSEEAITNLTAQLRQSPFAEVKWLAEQVQAAANQLRPGKFAIPRVPDILNAQENQLSKIAAKNLGQSTPSDKEMLSLQESWPRNEFALLIDALYPYSTSSRSEIAAELENWSYAQKKEAFSVALQSENSPLLEEARYRWNVVAQNEVLSSLKKTLPLQELQIQPNTPNYGYNVPEEIEAAAIDEIYIECFAQSSELYNALKNEGHPHLAEYAVLLGHKSRFQFITTAKDLKTAKAQNNQKEIKKILDMMGEKISENHALIGEFINLPPAQPKQLEVKARIKETILAKKPSLPRRRRNRKPKKQ
jgi:dTMP kinase